MLADTYEARLEFLLKAYDAYVSILTDAWFLKDMCQSSFRYMREKTTAPVEEVSWSDRRHELELARELRNLKIPYWRECTFALQPMLCEFPSRWRADFGLIGTNIFVEIDGGYHVKDADSKRDALLEEKGYRVVRFTVAEVSRKMGFVISKIQAEMSLRASSPLILRRCGILKSKKTTAT